MAFRAYRATSFNFLQHRGAGGGRVLQRSCACGSKAESDGQCAECAEKEGMLQRKSRSGRTPGEAPEIVHDVLRAPGQPLDFESRGFMEERFGYDFSHVRVHSDEQAHRSAEATDAEAYTVGQDIVFATGRYSPNTTGGRELLAHELTHVVQQDFAAPISSGAITLGKIDEHEASADETAAAVVSGSAPTSTVGATSVGLQRQPAAGSAATPAASASAPEAETPCLEEVVGEDVPSLLQGGVLTVIEFGGTSCKPCQRLKANLAEICQTFRVKPPPVTVRFYSIDIEVAGNEDVYDQYVPGGSVPHLYFYVGSTQKSHYDSAPEPDVLEYIMAEHIDYASTSGAKRGAKKGMGWGALAGGLAGIGGAVRGQCVRATSGPRRVCGSDAECDSTPGKGDGACRGHFMAFDPPLSERDLCTEFADVVVPLRRTHGGRLRRGQRWIRLSARPTDDPHSGNRRTAGRDILKLSCDPAP